MSKEVQALATRPGADPRADSDQAQPRSGLPGWAGSRRAGPHARGPLPPSWHSAGAWGWAASWSLGRATSPALCRGRAGSGRRSPRGLRPTGAWREERGRGGTREEASAGPRPSLLPPERRKRRLTVMDGVRAGGVSWPLPRVSPRFRPPLRSAREGPAARAGAQPLACGACPFCRVDDSFRSRPGPLPPGSCDRPQGPPTPLLHGDSVIRSARRVASCRSPPVPAEPLPF